MELETDVFYAFQDNPPMEDSHIVEKILGVRTRKPVHDKGKQAQDVEPPAEVEEFFVKYKNL